MRDDDLEDLQDPQDPAYRDAFSLSQHYTAHLDHLSAAPALCPPDRVRHQQDRWFSVLLDASAQDRAALVGLLSEGRRAGPDALHLQEPVFCALWNRQAWAAFALLDSGEPIGQRDGRERSLLQVACTLLMPKMVGALLARGAPVNAADAEGETALHTACHSGDETLARLLLDAGASVHVEDASGNTPLHNACWSKNAELCLMLVLRGANPRALNHCADTPLEFLQSTDCSSSALRSLKEALKTGQSVRAARSAIDELMGKAAGPAPPGP